MTSRLFSAEYLAPQPRRRPHPGGPLAELAELLAQPVLVAPPEPCKAVGCDDPANDSGWCPAHARYWGEPAHEAD